MGHSHCVSDAGHRRVPRLPGDAKGATESGERNGPSQHAQAWSNDKGRRRPTEPRTRSRSLANLPHRMDYDEGMREGAPMSWDGLGSSGLAEGSTFCARHHQDQGTEWHSATVMPMYAPPTMPEPAEGQSVYMYALMPRTTTACTGPPRPTPTLSAPPYPRQCAQSVPRRRRGIVVIMLVMPTVMMPPHTPAAARKKKCPMRL